MAQWVDLGFMKDERVLVLGLSRTGLSAGGALLAAGGNPVCWDDSEDARAVAESAGLAVENPDGKLDAFDLVVLSPGIPRSHPAPHPLVAQAEAAGVSIVGDIDLLAQAVPDQRAIAATGTNGKSTTVSLIGHLLYHGGVEAVVGGNIGRPALSLPKLGPEGWYVLELSSFQLETLSVPAWDIAILLNISPDHEDRYPSEEAYAAAKDRIFERPRGLAAAIIGADDDRSRHLLDTHVRMGRHRVIPISAERPVDGGIAYLPKGIVDRMDGGGERVLPLGALPALPGAHNRQNAAAAHAAARLAGLSDETIAAGMESFPGLAHRQQLVASAHGVRFVNDSKATNPDAAARALESYGDVYWIAGGKPKGDDYTALDRALGSVKRAFLIGEAADGLGGYLSGKVGTEISVTLDKAIQQAYAAARAAGEDGAVVLLSPACASFDQFENFEKRGERFADLARMLAEADTNGGRRAAGGGR